MNKREKAIVKGAMDILEESLCGDVGADGLTLNEMDEKFWSKGKAVHDNPYYDTAQHVWRVLEKLVKENRCAE